jgi:hypothetical protein
MMRFSSALSLFAGVIAIQAVAQTPATTANEIHQMVIVDQADRGDVSPGTKPVEVTPEQMRAHDVNHRKRARQLLEQGALHTSDDFYDAALIFQHGETPDDYLLAHVLAMVAVARNNEPRARKMAALTLDRYLQSIGQAQIFGTQFVTPGYIEILQQRAIKQTCSKAVNTAGSAGLTQTQPTENKPDKNAAPDAGDENKKFSEMVQGPYNTSFISDALRAEYCVPAISQQKEQVIEYNGGKPAAFKPIPGCSSK